MRDCCFERAVDINPNHPIANNFLATALVEHLGAHEEALPYIERAVAGGLKVALALLVLSLSAAGQADRLDDVESSIASLAAEGHIIPQFISAFRALRSSDQDGYLDAIEGIIDTGEFPAGILELQFSDFVRDHPRFKALMRRLGLAHVGRCPLQTFDPSLPPMTPNEKRW